MKLIQTIVLTFTVALLFAACGGGSSGGEAAPANPVVDDPQLEHAPADDPANDQLGIVDNYALSDGYRINTSGDQLGGLVFEFCGNGYSMASGAGGAFGSFSVEWNIQIMLDEFDDGTHNYYLNTHNMQQHSILVGERIELVTLPNNEGADSLLVETIEKIPCP